MCKLPDRPLIKQTKTILYSQTDRQIMEIVKESETLNSSTGTGKPRFEIKKVNLVFALV